MTRVARSTRARLVSLVSMAAVGCVLAFPRLSDVSPLFARAPQALELAAYDARLRALPPRDPLPVLRLVDIDEASVDRLGRWPWKRDVHARLIDRLTRAGAAVVAFDVSFAGTAEPRGADGSLPPQDRALVDAVRRSGRVVLARGWSLGGDLQRDKLPPELLAAAGPNQIGDVSVRYDVDGEVRSLPLRDPRDGLNPLWAVVLAKYLAGRYEIFVPGVHEWFALEGREAIRLPAAGPDDTLLIRFPGHAFPHDSYVHLLRDASDAELAELFKGRVAVVASTWDIADRFAVPRTAQGTAGRMFGGELHAAALDAVLARANLRRADPLGTWLALVILAAACVAALNRLRFRHGLLVAGSLLGAWMAGAWILFTARGIWLEGARPALVVGAVVLGALLYENSRVRQVLMQFVPGAVADDVVGSQEALERQEVREITAMFVDLRSYTSLSERLPADEVRMLVNRFHDALGKVYARHGGYVCSYQGDAQMVVFGAPRPHPRHAAAALQAARETCAAMDAVNVELNSQYEALARERGGQLLQHGVGLCTGPVSLGFVGQSEKREYSALGDAVNTAARLQGVARDLGVVVVIGATTARAAGDAFALRPLPPVSLKGKAEAQEIYTFADEGESPIPPG